MCTENANNNTTDNNYVLAMYDIRAKQEYIYRSTHMKEIVGASLLIRDCFWDFLRPAADEVGKKYNRRGIYGFTDPGEKMEEKGETYKKEHYTQKEVEPFYVDEFKKRMRDSSDTKEDLYIGEIVYDGGGNFFVLYKNETILKEVNQKFYVNVLKGTYSMRVLCTYIDELDFDNYKKDRDRLYEKHRTSERTESAIHPVNSLPIVEVDPRSSLPMSELYQPGMYRGNHEINSERIQKVSYESARKYEKYELRGQNDAKIEGARILDDIITQKGEDSHLAVIYIDGNNMGAQVQACISGYQSYEDCIRELRKFSDEIQSKYIDKRLGEIDDLLKKEEKHNEKRRFVVYAGDEITFVCNASQAYKVVQMYLKNLYNETTEIEEEGESCASQADGKSKSKETIHCTSCAGVAIFHSHAPFADAYRIAEECCETGKRRMKDNGVTEASLVDFHYCQGAIGLSLDQIRAHEGTEEGKTTRPWVVQVKTEKDKEKTQGEALIQVDNLTKRIATMEEVEDIVEELKKIGRSNVKCLGAAAKKSKSDFEEELLRIQAHYTGKEPLKFDELDFGMQDPEKSYLRKLIYDIILMYDLWFTEENFVKWTDIAKEDKQQNDEEERTEVVC